MVSRINLPVKLWGTGTFQLALNLPVV